MQLRLWARSRNQMMARNGGGCEATVDTHRDSRNFRLGCSQLWSHEAQQVARSSVVVAVSGMRAKHGACYRNITRS